LGPPEWLRPLISANISDLAHYPDPDCTELIAALARENNIQPEQILVGNGATELLHLLPRALGAKRVLIPVPSYADYEDPARLNGLDITLLPLSSSEQFCLDMDQLETALQAEQMVLLGQPNNPTGTLFDASQLRRLTTRHPETLFVIDESFIDFTDGSQSLRINRPTNVVIIQSLTKVYAIPGLRLGYAIADAEIITHMRRLLPNWTVNTIAQSVGCRAVQDQDYLQRSRDFVTQQREQLYRGLSTIPGLSVYPGAANFLLVRLNHDTLTAARLAEQTLKQGVAIRVCDNFHSLDQRYFRVAVRTSSEQKRLCEVMQGILCPGKIKTGKKKTPAIMFQGTGSNAGKSVLAAAMCRILRQDGYDVAPFKAQNMSLNSFVTPDGGEMGRAQVVQAQACRLEPDVRMNPVLLKPNSDTGSQIILHGKVIGNMHFRDYAEKRKSLFETIKSTYDELSSEHEIMVLEGAGSPAEINLKADDIVNMNMARHAEAPVLMVGDIDRGGVFASFVGTMELLTEQERARVAGFVINRFRGDASLLDSALDYTRYHTGVPVLGVVPFLHQLGLPEEDSVSFKDDGLQQGPAPADQIDIAIVDMPHISNFTDFDALGIEPDVHLRVVRRPKELGSPDALILPGSKNVLGDLHFLQESGLAEKVMQLAEQASCEIVGICGGFQILGRKINDPYRIESDGNALDGLGLLPLETVLARQKTTLQIRCDHLPSGFELAGYEIHHGQTNSEGMQPIAHNSNGEMIGGSVEDGRIWGTYMHGVFDADNFRRWFIDRLRARRGWSTDGRIRACYDLEPAFDRLADCVREALDMQAIYRSIGL
jgi:cobyric acid synthase CobQ/L-threonine-O-3-phosphate decarboxylase